MDWIDLAQDKERWRAPVNVVIHIQVPTLPCETHETCKQALFWKYEQERPVWCQAAGRHAQYLNATLYG